MLGQNKSNAIAMGLIVAQHGKCRYPQSVMLGFSIPIFVHRQRTLAWQIACKLINLNQVLKKNYLSFFKTWLRSP